MDFSQPDNAGTWHVYLIHMRRNEKKEEDDDEEEAEEKEEQERIHKGRLTLISVDMIFAVHS